MQIFENRLRYAYGENSDRLKICLNYAYFARKKIDPNFYGT